MGIAESKIIRWFGDKIIPKVQLGGSIASVVVTTGDTITAGSFKKYYVSDLIAEFGVIPGKVGFYFEADGGSPLVRFDIDTPRGKPTRSVNNDLAGVH